MLTPLNRHQPIRPIEDPESGLPLLYRVHPILDRDPTGKTYRTHEPANRLVQMQLYRWCRGDDFVQAPSCRELYDYLIGEPMRKMPVVPSINHLGKTVVNSVNYEPRKLKGKSKEVEKALQIYFFHSKYDLQYGLEYMICSWLRKFLNDESAPGSSPVSGPSMMEEELDILASSPWADYWELYVMPTMALNRRTIVEPDWRELLSAVRVDEDGIPIVSDQDEIALRPNEPKGGIRNLGHRRA